MKKIVSGIVSAFSLMGCGAAGAADLPTAPAYKSPVVAAVYNWTGFYVGMNGGYAWGDQDPLVPYDEAFTFDILPASTSGVYFAITGPPNL